MRYIILAAVGFCVFALSKAFAPVVWKSGVTAMGHSVPWGALIIIGMVGLCWKFTK